MRSSATWLLAQIVTWFWTPQSIPLIGISAPSAPQGQKPHFAPPEIFFPK